MMAHDMVELFLHGAEGIALYYRHDRGFTCPLGDVILAISLRRMKWAVPFSDKTLKRNGSGDARDDNPLFVYRDYVQDVG